MNGTDVDELVFSPSTLKKPKLAGEEPAVQEFAAALSGIFPSGIVLGKVPDKEFVEYFLAWWEGFETDPAAGPSE